MKNFCSVYFFLFLLIFATCLFIACPSSSDDSSESSETPATPQTPAENAQEEGLSVSLGNFYLWNEECGSYDPSSKKLTLKNGSGGNGAGFSFAADASAYKYARLSYGAIDLPNINFRLKYSDGSYSETYLQTHLTEAYIELDSARKSEITNIDFMTRQSEPQTGSATTSIVIKELKFVTERSAPQKSAVTDSKTSGTFDDTLTALELSDRIALGYSMGSGLNRAPFYNDKNGRKAGFGFQNNYGKDDTPLAMALEGQTTALSNQAGGMAFELCEVPLVTKELIDSVKNHGFSSIRICVTWYPHIIDTSYTIDPYFMERVKQVVDWAIADGLYVLLNEHHSVHAYSPIPLGYADGYNLTAADKAESEKYLTAVYRQICAAFNGSYDEHLIFEILNEPRVMTDDDSKPEIWASMASTSELQAATAILNGYNQLIVDTIRESGGNNVKRFIMVSPYATDYSTIASDYFTLPNDTATDKLMVAMHWYPLGFHGAGRKSYSDSVKAEFESVFAKAYTRFVSQGVPVTITEFGIENNKDYIAKYNVNEASDYTERLTCLKDFCEIAGKYGLSAMAWDDGSVHAVIDRHTYTAYDGDHFISALISSWKAGRKANPLPSPVELNAEDWSKTCDISAHSLGELSSSSALTLSLSKISGASYSVIRICPKGSDVSLEMASISADPSGGAELVESGSGGTSDGRGKNISLSSDSATVSYTLTSGDCEKIKAAGGISICGYGVKISSVQVAN